MKCKILNQTLGSSAISQPCWGPPWGCLWSTGEHECVVKLTPAVFVLALHWVIDGISCRVFKPGTSQRRSVMFSGSDVTDLASSSVFDALQRRKNQTVINIHNGSQTLNMFTRTSRQIPPPLTIKSHIKRYVSAQPDTFFGVRKWWFGWGGGIDDRRFPAADS